MAESLINTNTASNTPAALREEEGISWTASEFIAHDKTTVWYVIVIVISLVLGVLAFFFLDLVSAIIAVFLGVMFCIVGARQPRELPYKITSRGVRVDQKFYPFSNFKSFSVIQEEGIESIWFLPMKRFDPGLSIYFSPDQAQKIFEFLSDFVPFEPRELALFDGLMHKIRF